MTGFASLTHEDERATIGITVRAVNHRFLDLQLRMPQSLADPEPAQLLNMVQVTQNDLATDPKTGQFRKFEGPVCNGDRRIVAITWADTPYLENGQISLHPKWRINVADNLDGLALSQTTQPLEINSHGLHSPDLYQTPAQPTGSTLRTAMVCGSRKTISFFASDITTAYFPSGVKYRLYGSTTGTALPNFPVAGLIGVSEFGGVNASVAVFSAAILLLTAW